MSDGGIYEGPGGQLLHGNGKPVGSQPGSFAAPAGSLAHVHFEITTAAGNRAVIKGDPEMPEATRNALAQMIDALAIAVERGDFKKARERKAGRPEAKC